MISFCAQKLIYFMHTHPCEDKVNLLNKYLSLVTFIHPCNQALVNLSFVYVLHFIMAQAGMSRSNHSTIVYLDINTEYQSVRATTNFAANHLEILKHPLFAHRQPIVKLSSKPKKNVLWKTSYEKRLMKTRLLQKHVLWKHVLRKNILWKHSLQKHVFQKNVLQ